MDSQNPAYRQHREWGTVRLYRISHWCWGREWKALSLIFKYLNIVAFRCYVDAQAEIGDRLDLPHGGLGVVIGPKTRIGTDAVIFHGVTIGSRQPGRIVIGDRVLIGAGAIILGPVLIGHDVKIGANALVCEDIPDNSTVLAARPKIVTTESRRDESSGS